MMHNDPTDLLYSCIAVRTYGELYSRIVLSTVLGRARGKAVGSRYTYFIVYTTVHFYPSRTLDTRLVYFEANGVTSLVYELPLVNESFTRNEPRALSSVAVK